VPEEFCPNCGDWVDALIRATGWCRKCDAANDLLTKTQAERFLEANADHLEHYMLQGSSFDEALSKLRLDVRPICASCGAVIKRAGRNTVFCRKHERCRMAYRRYDYLYRRKGYSKAQALSQTLEEISMGKRITDDRAA
jgi:tRNA(Ile2) C34 agmatinyltransferase TiaS